MKKSYDFGNYKPQALVVLLGLLAGGGTPALYAASPSASEVHNTQGTQRVKVTGQVRDDKGEPLVAVQVIVVGHPGVGTTTDLDGKFELQVPAGAKGLKFTYLGYADVELALGGRKSFDVTMKEALSVLDDVVVVGYSTQKRSQMTTSVAKLDNTVLASAPRSNVATALQGTIPGLRVTQTTGQPGATPNLTLRGGTSFNGSGSPLILVDGVPSSFFGLNSDDIASIEVLKDAASTAIYGARAANGVILVTTKSGKAGRSSITFRTKHTINNRPKDAITYAGPEDFIRYIREGIAHFRTVTNRPTHFEAFLSGNNNSASSGNTLDSYYTTMYLTDANKHLLDLPRWRSMKDPLDPTKTLIFQDNSGMFLDAAFQNSHAQEYSLAFDGGNDKGTYYLGLSMLDDKGLAVNSSMKRLSMTFNGSYKINDKMKVSSSIMYIHSNITQPYANATNMFQRSAGQAPTARFWYANADGSDSDRPYPGTAFHFGNALYYKDKFRGSSLEQRFTASAQLDYKMLDNLTFTLRGNHFASGVMDENFNLARMNQGSLDVSRVSSISHSRTLRNQLTALANYNTTIKENHNITALLGAEYFEQRAFGLSAATKNAPNDLIPTMNVGAEAEGKPSSTHSEYAVQSLFGQLNYDYKMRYLVGLTFRYDGTSRLGNDKYGFFPGISLGWNVHNEDFFKNSSLANVISRLKPRMSYGVNGNIEVLGNYVVQGLYGVTSTYDSEKGFVTSSLPNMNLRWERSNTLNMGLDLGLFDNRITLMADFFIRNVTDKISGLTLPIHQGWSSIDTNNGTLQNRGIELQLSADVLKGKDWNWTLGANLTHVRSYAKKLPYNGQIRNQQGAHEIYTGEAAVNGVYPTRFVGGLQEGERLGYDLIIGYRFDGVYRTQADLDAHAGRVVDFATTKNKQFLGDAIWGDINGDNKIDSRDRVVLGRTTPDLIGGLSSDLSYKGWGLYIKTDFALGHSIVNVSKVRGLSQVQGNQGMPIELLDTWTPTNINAKYPRFTFTDPQHNFYAGGDSSISSLSSMTVESGSYFALREVTLSYNHDKPLFRGFVKGVRLYLTGSNLHYFTAYSGAMPESLGGIDSGTFPVPRSFTLGANITF